MEKLNYYSHILLTSKFKLIIFLFVYFICIKVHYFQFDTNFTECMYTSPNRYRAQLIREIAIQSQELVKGVTEHNNDLLMYINNVMSNPNFISTPDQLTELECLTKQQEALYLERLQLNRLKLEENYKDDIDPSANLRVMEHKLNVIRKRLISTNIEAQTVIGTVFNPYNWFTTPTNSVLIKNPDVVAEVIDDYIKEVKKHDNLKQYINTFQTNLNAQMADFENRVNYNLDQKYSRLEEVHQKLLANQLRNNKFQQDLLNQLHKNNQQNLDIITSQNMFLSHQNTEIQNKLELISNQVLPTSRSLRTNYVR